MISLHLFTIYACNKLTNNNVRSLARRGGKGVRQYRIPVEIIVSTGCFLVINLQPCGSIAGNTLFHDRSIARHDLQKCSNVPLNFLLNALRQSKHRIFLFEMKKIVVRINNKRAFIYMIIIFGLFEDNSFLLSFPLIATEHSLHNKLWKISLKYSRWFCIYSKSNFLSFRKIIQFCIISPRHISHSLDFMDEEESNKFRVLVTYSNRNFYPDSCSDFLLLPPFN